MIARTLRRLLPDGQPWRLVPGSMIRRFFDGLGAAGDDAREYIDENWRDLIPETTQRLADWERQFGVEARGLTEAERRDRLRALWSALGGQSPRYIQDTLRAAGFDVYVHEWWLGTSTFEFSDGSTFEFSDGSTFELAGDDAINPSEWLGNGLDIQTADGEPGTMDGEPTALDGNTASGPGYAIRNRRLLGDPEPVPSVAAAQWPYFWYVGAQEFGVMAQVSADRREEFERLLLQVGPAHMWIGVFVEYV